MKPNILFIVGEWLMEQGGPASVCCHLLERVSQHVGEVTILGKNVTPETKEWLGNQYNVRYIQPSEQTTDCVEALFLHEMFYPTLPTNVSHVVVFSPHAIVVTHPEGMLNRLPVDIRVAIVNTLHFMDLHDWNRYNNSVPLERQDLIGWISCQAGVSLVLSLSPRLHDQWERVYKSQEVKPKFNHVALLSSSCTSIESTDYGTSSNSKVRYLLTLPSDANLQFWQQASEAVLCAVEQMYNVNGMTLKWRVLTLPGLEPPSSIQKELVRVKTLSDVDDQLRQADAVLCSGRMSWRGYSGMEAVLSGIPTLIPTGSDVADLLQDVSSVSADFFLLHDDWCQRLCKMFSPDARKQAGELAKAMKTKTNKSLDSVADWMDSSVRSPSPPGVTTRAMARRAREEAQRQGENSW